VTKRKNYEFFLLVKVTTRKKLFKFFSLSPRWKTKSIFFSLAFVIFTSRKKNLSETNIFLLAGFLLAGTLFALG